MQQLVSLGCLGFESKLASGSVFVPNVYALWGYLKTLSLKRLLKFLISKCS